MNDKKQLAEHLKELDVPNYFFSKQKEEVPDSIRRISTAQRESFMGQFRVMKKSTVDIHEFSGIDNAQVG